MGSTRFGFCCCERGLLSVSTISIPIPLLFAISKPLGRLLARPMPVPDPHAVPFRCSATLIWVRPCLITGSAGEEDFCRLFRTRIRSAAKTRDEPNEVDRVPRDDEGRRNPGTGNARASQLAARVRGKSLNPTPGIITQVVKQPRGRRRVHFPSMAVRGPGQILLNGVRRSSERSRNHCASGLHFRRVVGGLL